MADSTRPTELVPMDVASRLPRVRGRLEAANCDALLVTRLANIRYLTGFSGSAGMLLVSSSGSLLVTDGRYGSQANDQLAAAGVETTVEVGAIAEQHKALLAAVPSSARLGLEATEVSWARQRQLAELFGDAELVPTSGVVEGLRKVKDPGELSRIESAAAIADLALAECQSRLPTGATEAAVAASLDAEMRRLGASGSAFETIVASGPNSAMPHARPSDRPIGNGELVVIDFGAVVDGYRSDMTRTLCVGEPASEAVARVVEVVGESQAAGLAAVRAGVSAAEVDRACREVISSAGWADAFVHGTGHGVGLDIHEAPAVGAQSADMLEEGSVVTVEPGVYLPSVGGARIEDTVVVTRAGCRVLTKSPKELIVT